MIASLIFFIFQQNILGATALHHAANEKIARTLLDRVPKEEHIKLLGTTDKKGRNILHRAYGLDKEGMT